MAIFSTFDPRNIIGQILRKYRIPQFAFCCLQRDSRVSRWRLERALRGELNFDNSEAEALVQLARDLAALADSFPLEEDGDPFNLEWRDTQHISGLLQRRREQTEKDNLRQRDQQNAEAKEEIVNSL